MPQRATAINHLTPDTQCIFPLPQNLVLLRREIRLKIARSVVRRTTARAAVLGALSASTCGSGELVLGDSLVAGYEANG